MKFAISGIAFLFSISAYACPQVNAQFNCVTDDGLGFEQTVASSVLDGVTTYRLTDDVGESVYVADGLLHSYDEEGVQDASYKASCSDNQVIVELKGTVVADDNNPGGEVITRSETTVGEGTFTTVINSTWNGYELPAHVEKCTVK